MRGKTEEYIHKFRSMTISGELDVCRIIILEIFINKNIKKWTVDSCSLGKKLGKAFVKIVMTFRDSDHSLQHPSGVELNLSGFIGAVSHPYL